MSIERKIIQRKQRRTFRSRKRLGRNELPRVTVFRSLNHIYAQLIDDKSQKTLASSSTLEFKDLKGDKKAKAHAIGLKLAEKAKALDIKQVVFDRGPNLYHGRIKALAEGLREGSLKI